VPIPRHAAHAEAEWPGSRAPAHHQQPARLASRWINRLHRAPKMPSADNPVRRYLKRATSRTRARSRQRDSRRLAKVAASGLFSPSRSGRTMHEYGFHRWRRSRRSMPIARSQSHGAGRLPQHRYNAPSKRAPSISSPRSRTSASGTQQSSTILGEPPHGPFHSRSGSIASELSATTSEPSPQKAGSDWVWNWLGEPEISVRPRSQSLGEYCAPQGGERNRVRWKGAPIQRLALFHPINQDEDLPGSRVNAAAPALVPIAATTKSMKDALRRGKWRDGYSA